MMKKCIVNSMIAEIPVGAVWVQDSRFKKIELGMCPGGMSPAAPVAEVEALLRLLEKLLHGEIERAPLTSCDFSGISDFQHHILRCLWKYVPRGRVISYGGLAELAGVPGAARAVGAAMNRNPFPLLIPCHRVVRSDRMVGEFAPGSELKCRLLEMEGVALVAGRVPGKFFR